MNLRALVKTVAAVAAAGTGTVMAVKLSAPRPDLQPVVQPAVETTKGKSKGADA